MMNCINVYSESFFLCGWISDQQMLEECEQQLEAEQQRCDSAKENLDWLVKTLSTVRAGGEHLADKLQHITLVKTVKLWGLTMTSFLYFWTFLAISLFSLQSEDIVAEVSPDSDEFVVELINQCEKKLQILQEELQGKDQGAIMKEMEEEEVRRTQQHLTSGLKYRLWI